MCKRRDAFVEILRGVRRVAGAKRGARAQEQAFWEKHDTSAGAIPIDRAGQKIGGTVNDSITLCMKRILKQATIVELENNPAELSKALTARTIDALGANRQRLTTLSTVTSGTRLLPDDLFNVPQNIVVPKDRPAALAAVNALIDEVRVSGLLRSAIERSGAIGVAVAPAGVKAGCPG